jgi:SAM-dependent methyltransferase
MSNEAAIDKFIAAAKESWGTFIPFESFTTPAAASLVDFAKVTSGSSVLDVACGTGVVAVTAATRGAKVSAMDLSPVLLERARENARIAELEIDFKEGNAEKLPYADASFDFVLSQFGHMFAPRPKLVIAEMLRVLKPGGRIAFSTWPPDLFTGRMFRLVSKNVPPPPEGISPPWEWGDVKTVQERLGTQVKDIDFDRATIYFPTLSPRHYQKFFETNGSNVMKAADALKDQPEKLKAFKKEFEALITEYFKGNQVHQQFLMTRARKK